MLTSQMNTRRLQGAQQTQQSTERGCPLSCASTQYPEGTQAHGEEEEETGAGWQVLGMLLRNPEHCPGDVICLLPTQFPPFFVGTVWGKMRGT